jgi:hypothetical protein
MITTPVVFIIFNRKDSAQEVFNLIRMAKPRKLYVIADGPREEVHDEAAKCRETRRILEQVDWKCDVNKNYARRNTGCGERISSGLDWVFRKEEEAIILEDDCVPSLSFFPYCEEMLKRYRNDARIMHINGSNFNPERTKNDDSYFFSNYVHVWGWATWRRAWKLYDYSMESWPQTRSEGRMVDIFPDRKEMRYWTGFFDLTYEKRIIPTTWDYQWLYAVWTNSGLCITPRHNLISNIGISGVHTDVRVGDPGTSGFFKERAEQFEISRHPQLVIPDRWYDRYHFRNHFYQSMHKRIHRKLWRLFH